MDRLRDRWTLPTKVTATGDITIIDMEFKAAPKPRFDC